MKKRFLTIDDLYSFFEKRNLNFSYSAKNDDDCFVVRVNGKLDFSSNDSKDGLYPVRVQANFVGDNLNNSRIEMSAQENALPSAQFRPLLAYCHKVNDQWEFYGHNMTEDEEGNIVYEEQPVGVICEKAHIEHDDSYNMDYAVANGYIWEEYSPAAEIIEREGKCSVSAELTIKSFSYNAKDKILVLDKFIYSGVTLLGVNDSGRSVDPAMPGSNITSAVFTADENNAIEVLSKIKDVLADFSIDKNLGKEETEVENLKKFEEVAETEEVTVTEESTEEEATAENTEDAADVTPETETVTEEMSAEGESSEGETVEEASEEEVSDSGSTEEDVSNVDTAEFSVTVNGETKTFSLSLNDKINALYSLVNETYGELDDDYYDVVVFEDTKTVEMHGWFRGKSYKQNYKTKKDEFSLIGDRVPISAVWMTDDEKAAFEKMKADFSVISEKLQKYEDEPKKMEILEHQKYNYVSDSKEFVELQADHFDMSIEEVEKKADEILLSYAENGKLKFSNKENERESKIKSINFGTPKTKTGRYGNLFSK